MKKFLLIASVFVLLTFFFACPPKYIPGTTVIDNDENRAIFVLVEKYRRAYEEKDVNTIMSLVSKNFYENGGNADSSDDYNFDGLRKNLTDKFAKTRAQGLEIRIKSIDFDKDNNKVSVKYNYFVKFQMALSSGDKWETASDTAEIIFVKENGEWKIIKGL
ncbi:MAG: nuclear transport factor 2 family protein [Deltaproteobacteria bacterium]|nr:nuclear transport factor 2 family protein [Deltaproteobacteria bacterium]